MKCPPPQKKYIYIYACEVYELNSLVDYGILPRAGYGICSSHQLVDSVLV